jgi:hypothetical protein
MYTADNPPPGKIGLTVRGDHADHYLRSLLDWLAHEDELRGRMELRSRPLAEGEMGGLADVLAVSLGSGGAGVVIAQALSTWLSRRGTDVTVTVKAPDGREISVDARGAEDPQGVIREVVRLTSPAQE